MPKREKVFIGIDPGKSGGVAVVSREEITEEHPLEEFTEKELWDWISSFDTRGTFVALERVHSFPRDGARSAFTFGVSYGQLRMALTAAKLPFDEILPQTWQKELHIPPCGKKTKAQHKKGLIARCQQLYPEHSVWTKLKKHQAAVADAILLATLASRRFSR